MLTSAPNRSGEKKLDNRRYRPGLHNWISKLDLVSVATGSAIDAHHMVASALT